MSIQSNDQELQQWIKVAGQLPDGCVNENADISTFGWNHLASCYENAANILKLKAEEEEKRKAAAEANKLSSSGGKKITQKRRKDKRKSARRR